MGGVLAVVFTLVVTALALPAGAVAHDEMCGGGGHTGGDGTLHASGTIPPPSWDLDCDLISSGPEDPDGGGPGKAGPDNCPAVRNFDQTDTDADGAGDACDDDDDDDDVPDTSDNCRTAFNPGQEDDNGDGRGNACPPTDFDGDGTFDDLDNCKNLPNADQANTDGDRQGDACDPDDDDDYLPDGSDNCPVASNQDQLDRDADGVGDACDPDTVIVDPGPVPGGDPNDHSAPRVTVRLARIQRLSDLLGHMATSVRCSEACAISGRLRRGKRNLAKGTATLAGAGRTWLFVRVRKGMAKRLVKSGRVRATLRLTVKDAAGNVTRARRTVLLKR